MNEVICLLSDGEEENFGSDDEIEVLEVPPPRQNSTAAGASAKKTSMNVSASDTAKTPRNPYTPSVPAPRVSLEPPETTAQTSFQTPRSASVQCPQNPNANRPTITTSTPRYRVVSQSSTKSGYDSDSSDDSLLNDGPTFAIKKKSPPPATIVSHPAVPSQASATAAAAPVGPPPPLAPSPRSSPIGPVPPPAVQDPPFRYPALLRNSKQYSDLRPAYIQAFWRHARKRTQHSYDRPKLDQLGNKIVLLALTPHPIRSLEEYCFGRGVGGGSGATPADRARRNDIEQQLIDGRIQTNVVTSIQYETKKYCSIAEACLVAMLEHVERQLGNEGTDSGILRAMDDAGLKEILGEKDMWMSLEDLIPDIDGLLKPECPARLTRANDADNGAAHYTETTTRSVEFLQIRKLETCHKELGDFEIPRIKRHTKRGKLLFELTYVGFRSALDVRERTFPVEPNFYRTSRIQRMSQVAPPYKNICIGVDSMEGGGRHNSLHEMCNTLDLKKVPFFVASFNSCDYKFFTRGPAGNLDYLCPILVERKSIEDIALSMSDGRWKSQKQEMYKEQYVFGYDNCRMYYIIEGKEEKQQVTGGYIGHRMHGVSLQRVKDEVEKLKEEGFEVIRTSCRKDSMFRISRWAEKVAADMDSGELTAHYTYEQLNEEVKKIPRNTDFSRLAKDAVARKEEAKAISAAMAVSKPSLAESDCDSDIEVLEKFSTTAARKPAAHPAASKRPRSDVMDSESDIEVLDVFSPPAKPASSTGKPSPSASKASARSRSPLIDRKKSAAARSFPRGDIDVAYAKSQKTPITGRKTKPAARSSSGKKSAAKKVKITVTEGDYEDWTLAQLKEVCKKCGLTQTGKKEDIIARLRGPRPPELWLERKRAGEYVPPRHNVGNTALLVALYLHEKDAGDNDRGLTKDELYVKAEGLEITKNPFAGGTTQTGPYHYDGWSGMKELEKGDPALVTRKKGRYKLTRSSPLAGYPFAEAMHKWCHAWGNCPCGATDV